LVLVTHDRYMLDRVSTVVLGLDGWGEIERFADYLQWDAWQRQQAKGRAKVSEGVSTGGRTAAGDTQSAATRKKLSYGEAREFATIEQRIAEEEKKLGAMRAALEDPAIIVDRLRLHNACLQVEEAQKAVDRLYARWAELEQRQG
jgi:ATP-binding cassette subfamily F protein uup